MVLCDGEVNKKK